VTEVCRAIRGLPHAPFPTCEDDLAVQRVLDAAYAQDAGTATL